jgi:hypothetical protein
MICDLKIFLFLTINLLHDLLNFFHTSLTVDVYFQVTGLGTKGKKLLEQQKAACWRHAQQDDDC